MLKVEVTRGGIVESSHLVHLVVHSALEVETWGDPDRPTFPRSSAKVFQALPLVESGAAARAGLTASQLALTVASHSGDKAHVEAVSHWLNQLGLTEQHLACGEDWPLDPDIARGCQHKRALYNCCSGKHTGFLTLAQDQNWSLDGYEQTSHPLQQLIGQVQSELLEAPLGPEGLDGCNIPTYANTLAEIARGFYNVATAKGLRGEACEQLVNAHRSDPFMIGGSNRLCTLANEAISDGMVKFGAEGVYTGASRKLGVGFAMKAEDGNVRAVEIALVWLLDRLGLIGSDQLTGYRPQPIRAKNGLVAGELRVNVEAL